ncbi:hypothetical protein [Oscillatoria sp. FACHB-1406]|uniref:hypothetical protein n=1 Tax=Oscillatoria sp. FACHB-1406 TaxID=2692846 RepID=UPI0016852BD9|nr:hypothetical protein [Oscillatoria sp. FACHB-1406]MBD2576586.1 hypothetical protein [Oscillatoria sp. FACHB-1406]
MARSEISIMAWFEFRQRFIPDFEKTYGRLPTEQEIVDAEARFLEYARSQGANLEEEIYPHQPPQAPEDKASK